MQLWHLTPDTPRSPWRVSPGERVTLLIGTWPIEPGQSVWALFHIERGDGTVETDRVDASWERNEGVNSYWRAELGPFAKGDRVVYTVHARAPGGGVAGPTAEFRVGPKLHLGLLWHQHQPLYRDMGSPTPRGSYLQPWVRLHALRDYYGMAALVAEHPEVHLTINFTPCLLQQIEDYVSHGATDRALELTAKPAASLTTGEREELQETFFDADWHNQIFPHARYKALFLQRLEGGHFSVGDLRDLQMWFNLAWFAKEFRDRKVELVTGERVDVCRFVQQGEGFTTGDVQAMVAEQLKVLRAVVPLHRFLADRGQLELSATPFYHPIFPLILDTDGATVDRAGAQLPRRFSQPEDADAQVRLAVRAHEERFGRKPTGMWPAEGAVSRDVIPVLARHGIRWIATDRGVLARSGEFGYEVANADVLCQPYRAEEDGAALAVFFRDTELSDRIGFHYHRHSDPTAAAAEFLHDVKERFAFRLSGVEDRILTIVLDGENAWGAYRDDGRPFLRALYGLLARDPDVQMVTFSEFLAGAPARFASPHPLDQLPGVHDLFTGSWIDEAGSAPGVDLGTWIGEPEENAAWQLLGAAREAVTRSGATPDRMGAAFEAVWAAEGSDWFWWFGQDQESSDDGVFDHLFRMHLQAVYRALALSPPAQLERHIVPHAPVWTFASPVHVVQPRDRLTVRMNCPGILIWRFDDGEPRSEPLVPAGGVLAGTRRHQRTIGPAPEGSQLLRFTFRCTHPGCACDELCCRGEEVHVLVERAPERPARNSR